MNNRCLVDPIDIFSTGYFCLASKNDECEIRPSVIASRWKIYRIRIAKICLDVLHSMFDGLRSAKHLEQLFQRYA
jgi:hypothetical protein